MASRQAAGLLVASAVVTVLATTAAAETRQHVLGGRSLTSGSAGRTVTSVDGSDDARGLVQRIIGAIGIPTTRFDVRASNDVPNAEATTENGGKDRLILYNPNWLGKLKASTTNWSDWMVLAHEVGHHVAFHMDPSFPNHDAELQADYFAGFILHKLGAPLVDVQLAMAMVATDRGSDTHPAKALRVAEIKNGWEAAARNVGANVIPATLAGSERANIAPTVSTRTEQRTALLIGNANYKRYPLKNPKNDVVFVGRVLRRLGFATTVIYDGSAEQIAEAIKDFGSEAAASDWAIVYYAGSGIEVDGINYMIPVDADEARLASFPAEAPQMRLDTAFDAVKGARRLRLVVLDACRIDPANPPTAASTAKPQKFKVVEPPTGVVVAYSTAAGQYAQDGEADLSPFAQILVSALQEPGIELPKVFRRVSAEVQAATRGAQLPSVLGNWPPEDLPVAQK